MAISGNRFFAVFAFAALLFSAFAVAYSDVNTVTVCRGEPAVFEYELHNKIDPLTYAISPQGITGTTSVSKVSLAYDERVSFSFTVTTSDKAIGNYPFTMVADGGRSVSKAESLLIVANCYDSGIVANPSTLTIVACSSGASKVTVSNTGTKADTFVLSSSGPLSAAFSSPSLSISPSSAASSDVSISVPCGTSAGQRQLQVASKGKSSGSASITVQVVTPTPTPTPKGCAYNNPACAAPQVCQDNKCVLPSGCKYNNPSCPAGFSCDNASNACREIPKVPDSILTSAVQYDVCRGESVKYDYEITNPANFSQRYSVSSDGVSGAFSPSSSFDVGANQKKAFSLSVDTSPLLPKTYYFNVVATAGNKSVRMQSGLRVRQCYASALSLQSDSLSLCPSQVKARTVTVRNTGAQSDVYALSASGAGDIAVEFQPSVLFVPAGEEKTAQALFTAPVSPNNSAAITRDVSITATSNSISTSKMAVTMGDAASCPLDFDPALYLSAVRACPNETARLKFDLFNPSDSDLLFNMTVSGAEGKISPEQLFVKSSAIGTFYYAVETAGMPLGKYPISVVARADKASARAASMLIVEDCFGSNLTLVNVTVGGQLVASPSPSPSATAVAVATAVANATSAVVASATPAVVANATAPVNASAVSVNASALKVLGVEYNGTIEAYRETPVSVVLFNAGSSEISAVRVFVSNALVVSAKSPSKLSPGELARANLTIISNRSEKFNATIRAVAEEASADGSFFVNASSGPVSASVSRTTTQTVQNGSRENVTATVRLKNSGKAAFNATLSSKERSVSVSPSNVSIPASGYVDVSVSAELPSDKEYDATLVVSSPSVSYQLPVKLSARTGGSLTGLVFGNLASSAALALVLVAVAFVLLYLSKSRAESVDDSEDDEASDDADEEDAVEDSAEDEVEEDADEQPSKKKKKG